MKPTKNRVFCKDCGKVKMLFEDERKAETFMKFNNEEIASLSGTIPLRSYYCISCCGWHITSKEEKIMKSKTEIIVEAYNNNRMKKLTKTQPQIETKAKVKTKTIAPPKETDDEIAQRMLNQKNINTVLKNVKNISSQIDDLNKYGKEYIVQSIVFIEFSIKKVEEDIIQKGYLDNEKISNAISALKQKVEDLQNE